MNDPFDLLRQELVDAAGRVALPVPSHRRRWLPRPPRPVSIVLAALVITGSAAAAVFSLTGSRSQPLAGKVPGAIEPASVAGYRYTITVTPSLYTGTAGWESFITYSTNSSQGSPYRGGGGGGAYPTATNPLFGGSCFDCGGSVSRGNTVGWVLTSPQVVALRIGDRTIRTLSSPSLPAGDRAAVFFIPARGPTLVEGWQPGKPVHGEATVWGCPCRHGRAVSVIGKIRFVAILPLDRYGHAIATRVTRPYGSTPSFWQAPSIHASSHHSPTHARAGVCELRQHGLPALHGEWGATISAISPAKDALGEVFLSCLNTEYYLHGWPLQVAVLLDGRQPGQVLGPIPGARPVPGQPNIVNLAAGQPPGSLTAKRVGNAWLVAEGGSGLAQRITVLNALQISKLDLHHRTSERAPYSMPS
ncbi:MAG TPA: hypothetical protein VFA16_00310 [Mycobacterium sp.]|uniref:hypothetical protein n=1 Tax=Mycobacterium sp. TaxID=1785 RepID=UPI002D41EBF9|nr:hypothetical protein [Mycobacterium sp.]HZU45689.1 hypothetical protein [Mycobacterium sp.]